MYIVVVLEDGLCAGPAVDAFSPRSATRTGRNLFGKPDPSWVALAEFGDMPPMGPFSAQAVQAMRASWRIRIGMLECRSSSSCVLGVRAAME